MKIAIISKKGHMECLGFLLELLIIHNLFIFYDNNTDIHNWIDYYKIIYNFNTVNNLNINFHEFDKVIKLTNNDDCLTRENTISLLHLKSLMNINNNSNKFISLTPYINGENIFYMFPIFKPLNLYKSNSNTVLFIGYYLNNNFDNDTISFIKNNSEYNFIFVLWGDSNYNNLTNIQNVTFMKNVNTLLLTEYIKQSKFIMSKKYINYDRFSGQLGLAMSFEKPLIIDSKTASSYNLPGFIFNNDYTEIGKINSISDEKYNDVINKIKIFNENTIIDNKNNINKILN